MFKNQNKIYISCDHGGFELKTLFVDLLQKAGFEVLDYGPKSLNPGDDYPDFIVPMIINMQKDKNFPGIVICKNGVGVSIAANKFKGIRAGLCFSKEHVKTARNDDNINVLALPSDFINKNEAVDMLHEFMNTGFSTEDRHHRRITKINNLGCK